MYVALREAPWCGCYLFNRSGEAVHHSCETLKEIVERKKFTDERTGFPSHKCSCELIQRKDEDEIAEALKQRVKEWLAVLVNKTILWCTTCNRSLLRKLEGHPCFPVLSSNRLGFSRALFDSDVEDTVPVPLSPIPGTPSPIVSDCFSLADL